MRRFLLLWLASLLIGAVCGLPASRGQQPPAAPAQASTPAAGSTEASPPSQVLAWGVAVVFTLSILCIVCMPSRKS